jgi:hypothetical protein
MRVAIAQLNQRVGDLAGNAGALATSMAQARAAGAALCLSKVEGLPRLEREILRLTLGVSGTS